MLMAVWKVVNKASGESAFTWVGPDVEWREALFFGQVQTGLSGATTIAQNNRNCEDFVFGVSMTIRRNMPWYFCDKLLDSFKAFVCWRVSLAASPGY